MDINLGHFADDVGDTQQLRGISLSLESSQLFLSDSDVSPIKSTIKDVITKLTVLYSSGSKKCNLNHGSKKVAYC